MRTSIPATIATACTAAESGKHRIATSASCIAEARFSSDFLSDSAREISLISDRWDNLDDT